MVLTKHRLLSVLLAGASALMAQTPEVEPIFRSRCLGCHNSAQAMSGLRLDAREGALKVVTPGDSGKSKLIQRVTGAPGMIVMPPSGPRLTASEIATLREWIDKGAPWQQSSKPVEAPKNSHWAFQPVRRSAVPGFAAHPVDAFVLARLKKEGIEPSPEADKRTLLRRVSLDLTGLPPTPEETRAFLATPARCL